MAAVQTVKNHIFGLDGGFILDLSPRDAGRFLTLSSVTGQMMGTNLLPGPVDFEYIGGSQARRPGFK